MVCCLCPDQLDPETILDFAVTFSERLVAFSKQQQPKVEAFAMCICTGNVYMLFGMGWCGSEEDRHKSRNNEVFLLKMN